MPNDVGPEWFCRQAGSSVAPRGPTAWKGAPANVVAKTILTSLPTRPSNTAASSRPQLAPGGRNGSAHACSPPIAVPKTFRNPRAEASAGDGGAHPRRPSWPYPAGEGVGRAALTRTQTHGRAPTKFAQPG